MDARTKFTVALKQSCVDLPQIATMLLRLSPREKEGIGTVGADQRLRFYYDPEVMDAMPVDEVSFEQKMAIAHAFLSHGSRGSFLDDDPSSVEAWKKSTRISAVEFLKTYGQEVPPHAPCCDNTTDVDGNPLPQGLCSEEYYGLLLEGGQEPPPPPEGPNGPDEPEEHKGPVNDTGRGGGGEIQDGKERDWQDEFKDDDINSRPDGPNDGELEKLRSKLGEGLKSMGRSGCGDFAMVQDSLKKPKIRPEQLLRMAIARNVTKFRRGTSQPTYRRVSRRQQIGDPFIKPSHVDPTPKVTVVVDTSASMTKGERELGLGMVDLALKGMKLDEVRVVGADTQISSDQFSIRNASQVKLTGGGGTRMDEVVNTLLSEPASKLPDLLILVTDGGTKWPDRNKVPVISCVTQPEEVRLWETPPDWMPLVYVG